MKTDDELKVFHNLIIMDESGSMSSIERQALSGINETIMTIRKAQEQMPELKQTLTLVLFDDHGDGKNVRTVFEDMPIVEVRNLTDEDYNPNGCTPLYDAMGMSLAKLQGKVDKDDYALVTIITDGLENASHEYSCKAIKSIVGLLREKGWIFNYVGANQDAVEVANELNIDHAMNFEASAEDTERAFHEISECSMDYIVTAVETERKGRKLFRRNK